MVESILWGAVEKAIVLSPVPLLLWYTKRQFAEMMQDIKDNRKETAELKLEFTELKTEHDIYKELGKCPFREEN